MIENPHPPHRYAWFKSFRILLVYTVIALIYMSFLADMVTGGFATEISGSSPSQMARVVLLFLMVISLVLGTDTTRLSASGIIILFLLLVFFQGWPDITQSTHIRKLAHAGRFMTLPVTAMFFRKYDSTGIYGLSILKFLMFFFAVNILLSLIGLGYVAYDTTGAGARGLIFSANQFGIAYAIVGTWFLGRLREQFPSAMRYWVYGIVILLGAVATGTKFAIGLTFVGWLHFGLNKGATATKRRLRYTVPIRTSMILLVFAFCVSAVFLLIRAVLAEANMVTRFTYFVQQRGIWGALLSGREQFVQTELPAFFSGSIQQILFGMSTVETVEMDLFDPLLNYGLIGSFSINAILAGMIVSTWRQAKRNSAHAETALVILSLAIGMSLAGGHLVFSALAGSILGIMSGIASGNKVAVSAEASRTRP
jgi:hypothetical protein